MRSVHFSAQSFWWCFRSTTVNQIQWFRSFSSDLGSIVPPLSLFLDFVCSTLQYLSCGIQNFCFLLFLIAVLHSSSALSYFYCLVVPNFFWLTDIVLLLNFCCKIGIVHLLICVVKYFCLLYLETWLFGTVQTVSLLFIVLYLFVIKLGS